MISNRHHVRWALAAVILVLSLTRIGQAAPSNHRQPEAVEVAQASDNAPRELEPRYQPVEPQPEKSWYNDSYMFAATRGVAHSTMAPAAKMSLYPLSVLFDIVVLPFAAIGGLFG